MRPLNTDIELETPPWICMEFSRPTENRQLGDLMQLNKWKEGTLEIRTWEKTKDALQHGGQHMTQTQGGHGNTFKSVDGSIIKERELKTRSIADMKGIYTLLDD